MNYYQVDLKKGSETGSGFCYADNEGHAVKKVKDELNDSDVIVSNARIVPEPTTQVHWID